MGTVSLGVYQYTTIPKLFVRSHTVMLEANGPRSPGVAGGTEPRFPGGGCQFSLWLSS